MIICPWKEIKKYASMLPGSTLYIKNKGIKTNYKIISRIINDELGDLVELREMRHGYRLIAPIQDVERILLNNIVIGAEECLHSNNVNSDKRMESIDIVVSRKRWLPLNNVKISLLEKISDWVQGAKPKNYRF